MHFRGTAAIESLESRRLLSVTVAAKKATLDIVGTAGDDKILVTAHPSLINFVNVVVKNAGGREDVYVATGRFSTIKVDALGGDDEIMIDNSLRGLAPDVTVWLDGGAGNDRVLSCSLPGTIAMRDGNDIVKLTSNERLTIYGDAGNDRLDVGPGAHLLEGGDGNDTLVAGDGAQTVRGGAGDDRLAVGMGFAVAEGNDGNDDLRVPSGQKKAVDAGAGDDVVRLFVPSTKPASGDKTSVLGGAGNDSLYGSKHADQLSGGAENDRLYAEKGARGGTYNGDGGDDLLVAGEGSGAFSFKGGSGDDILDARGSTGTTLYGGDGNDDLYAGIDTIGKGEAGRDWFSDSKWKEKDQDEDDVKLGGSPNSGWYGGVTTGVVMTNGNGVNWGSVVVTNPTVTTVTRIHLKRLDDLGFVTTPHTSDAGSAARTIEITSTGTTVDRRVSPTLLAKERKGVRNGIVRLPAGWWVGDVERKQRDFVWYNVHFGKGGDLAKSGEFGIVYQLCVKAGSVVVTSDGSYTTASGRIARARVDTLAMSLAPGSTARIAGDAAAYTISGDVLDAASIKAPKGRRGILVDGGAIWLASGDASTAFVAG